MQKTLSGDEEVNFARHWTMLTRELQEREPAAKGDPSHPAAPQQNHQLGTGPSAAPDQVQWWGRSRVYPGDLDRRGGTPTTWI